MPRIHQHLMRSISRNMHYVPRGYAMAFAANNTRATDLTWGSLVAAVKFATDNHRRLARLNHEDIRELLVQFGAAGGFAMRELRIVVAVIGQLLAGHFIGALFSACLRRKRGGPRL